MRVGRSVLGRRARILMLVDALNWSGGAERLVGAIATHLPQDRFDVTICATRWIDDQMGGELDEAGIATFTLGRSNRLDIGPFRRLVRFVRANRIDVLHAHKFPSNVVGAVTRPLTQVPVVIAHDHGWSHQEQWRRFVEGRVIGSAVDAFVSGTAADADHLVSEGVHPDKVFVIPGAYIPRPSDPAADIRDELGLAPHTPLIGTVGVLRPEKGYEVLVDAFGEIARANPGAHLVIAGDGETRPELERLALRLGLTERTHFLGMRTDVGAVLRALDVATLTSDRESTSLFALECMAYKTPLVSTRVGGPAEFLEDGVSAILVPTRDPSALATGVQRLLSDPDEARRLAEAAHSKLADFTIEAVAARHAELYGRLLDRSRPSN